MRNILLLLGFLSLGSCALLEKRGYRPYSERMDECVKSYLMMDVKPEGSVKICESIHGKRE